MGNDDELQHQPDPVHLDTAARRLPVTSVHRWLGGGPVADILLWRRPTVSASVLLCSTVAWYLFERAGYSVISFTSNVILLLVVILFLWAKSAGLLNRPLPPLPDLEISEQTIEKIADVTHGWVNCILAIARDIAVARNLKRFFQVAFVLMMISHVGSFFSLLTLLYALIVLSLTLPILYNNYQDSVDEKFCKAHKFLLLLHKKLQESVLGKIPVFAAKQKKMQ